MQDNQMGASVFSPEVEERLHSFNFVGRIVGEMGPCVTTSEKVLRYVFSLIPSGTSLFLCSL